MILNKYTFDASAKTITFDGYDGLAIAGFKLITNLTDGVVIYQFNSSSKNGTIVNNVLTLTFDTTSMSDTDELMVIYEHPSSVISSPATEESVSLLKRLLILLKPLGIVTGAQSNRLSVDVNSQIVVASGTITTVSQVVGLTNITNIGGVTAFSLMKDTSRQTFANSVRTRLT